MRTSAKVEDAIKLIRSKGLLEEWSDLQIHTAIDQSIKDFAMSYTLDENNQLDGICFGRWLSATEYYCTCCVGKVITFIDFLKYNHPLCKEVIAERNGQIKAYKL